jgi:ABC-type sugar transport system permease subunit
MSEISTPIPASAQAGVLNETARARAVARKKWRESFEAYLWLAPAFLFIAFVFVYPIIEIFHFSTLDMSGAEPLFVGWRNYQQLFKDPIFWGALRNNLLLLLFIPIILSLALIIASLLYDRGIGWQIYRTVIFLPYMLAIVVIGLAFSRILELNGALNTVLRGIGLGLLAQDWLGSPHLALFSIGGVIVWRELGFGTVLFLARLMSVSEELFDAAKVDGASWWQRLFHVTIPQLRNVIIFYATILLITLFSWVFNYVYVMTDGGPAGSTIVSEFYIYLHAFKYFSMGTATAFSVILLFAALVIMFVQYKLRERMDRE